MTMHEDIKHGIRPQYDDLHLMSRHDRAAQFSPSAALVGYGDAVAETVRLTDSRVELTEDEMFELNANQKRLLDSLEERPKISVTYFVPMRRSRAVSMWKRLVWCGNLTAVRVNLCSRTVCG